MIKTVPFSKAVKYVTYVGVKGVDKEGNVVSRNICIHNPSKKLVRTALNEHVRGNNFKISGLNIIPEDIFINQAK